MIRGVLAAVIAAVLGVLAAAAAVLIGQADERDPVAASGTVTATVTVTADLEPTSTPTGEPSAEPTVALPSLPAPTDPVVASCARIFLTRLAGTEERWVLTTADEPCGTRRAAVRVVALPCPALAGLPSAGATDLATVRQQVRDVGRACAVVPEEAP